MKRFSIFILMFVFLIGAIGLDIKVHYCGSELMQVSINGLPINTSASQDMPGCMDGDGCHSCKNIYKSYKVNSQFSAGQVVLIQPALSANDWFHGGMPLLAILNLASLLPTVGDKGEADFIYLARSHPSFLLPPGGLRAPPVA
ncbi:MAG: hypothetical protein I3J02_05980 [Prevotella sp.]|nr:hypothetical protein [Prevotella sp.]